MLIKRIDGSTRQLGAPADWDGKDMSCGVLPILDVQTSEGNFMFSAWEPTPPELEALNKGANILLGVRGTAHPVVSLQVAADAEVKHPDDIAVDQFAEVMKAKLADARAKGRAGWQHCDPAELSFMLREHVEKGDPRDVANFCMFLWSLGKPIGDARPALDMKLTPLNGIQVWIDAYTNPANGPNFMGHGRIVQLLREYLALRKLLAPRTLPPLPETHYNGCGDGSEPLYTADMVHLYAIQYATQLALPAGPVPDVAAIRTAALKEAAQVCWGMRSRPEFGEEIQDRMLRQAEERILALAKAPSPAVAQPVADERIDEIMSQAQVFASAWSMIGTRFDDGGLAETAEAEKTELRRMIRAALCPPAEEGGKA